jgi:hypothetical protein
MSVANGAYTRTNLSQDAGKVYARFFIDSVQDHVASTREGRPIFKDEERVEIIFPGNQHTKPIHKVTQEHKDRWPQEYAAFKAGTELAVNGTPLEQWPILKRAQVLELKAINFRTVEEVANMSDLAMQRLGMGGARLRELAKAYLDDAAAGAMLSQSTAENERAKARIAELEDKVNNLSALCDRMHGDLQGLRNAPSPIATYVPGQHDPAEAARQAFPREEAAASSLNDMPAPRRRGRPAAVEEVTS